MSPEELSMLFEAAQEDFEVKNGQPTDACLVKIRAVITSILLLAPYDEENVNHNLVGFVWSKSKYKATHQGNFAFHSLARPEFYDPTITDDNKPAVVWKKNHMEGARKRLQALRQGEDQGTHVDPKRGR